MKQGYKIVKEEYFPYLVINGLDKLGILVWLDYGTYFKCSKFEGFRIWFFENEHQEFWSIGRKDYDNDNTDFIYGGINYVHQLQNLYFALTGNELTVKEYEE